MLKPTILIGTLLVSNLAGVCCAMAMPAMNHHGMTDSGTIGFSGETSILPLTSRCNSQQMENDSFIERDQGRGCVMSERMKQGGGDFPLDHSPATANRTTIPISTQRYYINGCWFHGASPPRILEQSSGKQLLF
ncbi:MAG: hypothetical protein PHZ00_00775 [Candidatus Peribacteraceae bacterium]|nr:hypothetical protein [Candidatus Peribacteraceae bacterium]